MKPAAASAELLSPASVTQQMCRVAMGELLEMTLRVAAVATRLVEVEGAALAVLTEAAAAAARGVVAAPESMEAAIEAGRVADANEAARETMVARMAVAMEIFKKASRSARLTALLAQRIEQPPRAERDWSVGGETRVRAPGQAGSQDAELQDREPSERQIDREQEDELGDRPTEAVLREICRGLGIVTAAVAEPGAEPPVELPGELRARTFVEAYRARANRPAEGVNRPYDPDYGVGRAAAPEPDT